MGQVTIGAIVYDIYGTEADAEEYFAASLEASAWNDATVLQKQQALVTGTRWIDRLDWQGAKTSDAQPLEFPRTGIDGLADTWEPEEANYELALALLVDSSLDKTATTGSNTKRVKAGSAEVEFFKPTDGLSFPTIVQQLIGQYLASSAGLSVGLASGTDEESAFCSTDNKLTRGYA